MDRARRHVGVPVTMLLTTLMLLPATHLTTRAAAAPVLRPARVALFGDSFAWEAEPYFSFFAALQGWQVRAVTAGGTALCDVLAEMDEVVSSFDPDVVVVAFTGNNTTPCVRGHSGRVLTGPALVLRYAYDAGRAMSLLSRRGAVVHWIGPPVPRHVQPAFTGIRRMYQDLPDLFPSARYVEGDTWIAPGERWAASQPCLSFEPCEGPLVEGARHNRVRADDGAHFCPGPTAPDTHRCTVHSSGALRYALNLLPHAPLSPTGP
jgi:hypothetical protein